MCVCVCVCVCVFEMCTQHSRSLIRIFIGRILDSSGCEDSLCGQWRLIRLHWCAGWFESSLGKHIRRYVFSLVAQISGTNLKYYPNKHTTSQQRRVQRRCDGLTLQRRCNDVVATLCVCWDGIKALTTLMGRLSLNVGWEMVLNGDLRLF